jgi:hypothetical protein
MEPIRTDFRGYEGQYVATDARTGEIVLADKDLHALFAKSPPGHRRPSARYTVRSPFALHIRGK